MWTRECSGEPTHPRLGGLRSRATVMYEYASEESRLCRKISSHSNVLDEN